MVKHGRSHRRVVAENDGQQERDEDGYTKEERKRLARENARATYPPLLLYLFYLCIKYAFMNFEPFQTISDLQENVKTFLVGMAFALSGLVLCPSMPRNITERQTIANGLLPSVMYRN